MKNQLIRIYLLLAKNKITLFLTLIILFTIKQLLFYVILFNQGQSITKTMLVGHVLIQLFVLLLVLLIIRSYKQRSTERIQENEDLKQKDNESTLLIERLKNQLSFYTKTESTDEETVDELVEKIASKLYGGLRSGETLDIASFFRRLCLSFEVAVGVLYECKDKKVVQLADFDLPLEDNTSYLLGEGIIGQVAKTSEPIILCNLPGQYFDSFSGLGNATPKNLQVFKIGNYVFEIATHTTFSKEELEAIEKLMLNNFSKKS